MGHVISSNYAMDRLLKPLGINIKRLYKCTIVFEIDDAVRITTEHFLEEPTEEAETEIKRYYLAELIDDIKQE